MKNQKNMFLLCIIIFTSYTLFSTPQHKSSYQITMSNEPDEQSLQPMLKFFDTATVHSQDKFCKEILKEWAENNTNIFVLAHNKHQEICGMVIYYISPNQKLSIRIIAMTTTESPPEQKIITEQLLSYLDAVPEKNSISTVFMQNDNFFYNILQGLHYKTVETFLAMSKQITGDTSHASTIQVQSLDTQNVNEIQFLSDLFKEDEVGISWTFSAMQRFVLRSNYRFLIACNPQDGQPCGGLMYKILPTYWKIDVLAVKKEYRRQGVATALIAYLEEQALLAHIPLITLAVLPTNNNAIGLYKKNGFTEQGVLCKMVKNTPVVNS